MCVIVYKSEQNNVDFNLLQDVVISNPDGLGVAIYTNNRWKVYKYLTPTDKDLKDLVDKLEGKKAVIHARIATSGGVIENNLHPFKGKNYTLFHNGIIPDLNGILSKHSDTRLLSKMIDSLKITDVKELLKNLAKNTNSKFALIDNNTNKVYLIGHYQAHKGLQCSNLYFTYQYDWNLYKFDNIPTYKDVVDIPDNVLKEVEAVYGTLLAEDKELILDELNAYNKAPTVNNIKEIVRMWYNIDDTNIDLL